MANILEQLSSMSVIVADTGDVAMVEKFKPQDCTTNPSLVLAALKSDSGQGLIEEEIAKAKADSLSVDALCDKLTVALGAQLSTVVPGRVSTEVDACLSFDRDKSIRKAHGIIEEYAKRGVSTDRVLIKLASTWEGIRAAEALEKDGIQCNLTLLFSMEQAKACADAGVYLISPFVGRITDWFKKAEGVEGYAPDEDPGVKSVREIYAHYKSSGIETIVMGASFRNTGQIKALAGCDRLTISPGLLDALAQEEGTLEQVLKADGHAAQTPVALGEADFRWGMNESAMATEKVSEGIRNFNKDHQTLLQILATRMEG